MSLPFEEYVRHLQSNIARRANSISNINNLISKTKSILQRDGEFNTETIEEAYKLLKRIRRTKNKLERLQKLEKDMYRYFIYQQRLFIDEARASQVLIDEFAEFTEEDWW